MSPRPRKTSTPPRKTKPPAVVDAPLLGFIVNNLILEMFGFSPSETICEAFAAQVITDATEAGVELKVP